MNNRPIIEKIINRDVKILDDLSKEELAAGAERFALSRGGRSPRCAKHYIESIFC